MDKILIIGGPTATGKSGMAVKLAKRLNGEIVCADSMQIYKSMNIVTAKTTDTEKEGIVHHMMDMVDPNSEYSVAEYAQNAINIINDIVNRGKLPIIVGGTGLYIDAILYPLSFSSAKTDITIRKKLQEELFAFGKDYMYERLEKLDKKRAEMLNVNDTKRVLRALELLEIGIVPSEKKDQLSRRFEACIIGLNVDRDKLYEKINKRVDLMFELGLKEEIDGLLSSNLCDFKCQSMQAIGYKEFKDFYEGKITLDEARELIKKHTRNYAKRQITWFKKYNDIFWVDVSDKEAALENIIHFYYEK